MALFVISYDLIKGKDYAKIISELERLGAQRVLLSVWLADVTPDNPEAIKDHLAKFADEDDRLLVIEFKKKPAYTRALTGTAAWIKKKFP